MRCEQASRELTMTGGHDPAALAAHLAACPRCAALAGRLSQLDRAWEATRPADPPAVAWDAVWARVSEGLEAPAPLRVGGGTRRRSLWLAPLSGLAAAAALVLAAWLGGPGSRPTVELPDLAEAAPSPYKVEFQAGEVGLFSVDSGLKRTVVAPAEDDPSGDQGELSLAFMVFHNKSETWGSGLSLADDSSLATP